MDGTLIQGKIHKKKLKEVKIDSRIVKRGDIFIAIIGKNLDGHKFLKEAIKHHPSCIIVSEPVEMKTEIPLISVTDTTEALQKLAYQKHKQYPVPVIAITGSIGKTTTKELVATILSRKYCVLKSEGNFNNHIGLPLTMLKLNAKHELMVVEMGMNHAGEIKRLSLLAHPNTALITNIGTSHIGYLKTQKNIFKAKMEIVEGMQDGTLLLNGEDKYLKSVRKIKQGTVEKVCQKDFHVKVLSDTVDSFSFQFQYQDKPYIISIKAPVSHLLETILMAMQVGLDYGVSIDDMIDTIEHYPFQLKGRMEHISYGNGQTLIDDTYNASFESTIADLNYLKKLPGRKCFIFGDILELGCMSKKIHLKLARVFKKEKEIHYIFIGESAYLIHKKIKGSMYFPDVIDYLNYIAFYPLTYDYVLVKASRNMHLDEIVNELKKK